MTLSQFLDLLARLGPALAGWPGAAVDPALDLLQTCLPAQDAFIRATALDMALSDDWRRPAL